MSRQNPLLNRTVRSILIERARQGKPIAYGGVMARIGLDHVEPQDRATFSNILETISRYEASRNGRPMLSAMIMYQGLKDIGDKFYWLAHQLGHGSAKRLKEEAFDVIMQKTCHQFWSDNSNYLLFKDDIPAPPAPTSKWLIAVPASEGTSTPLQPTFKFSAIEVDWLAINAELATLGGAGEKLVLEYEKEQLLIAGKPKLAKSVAKVPDGKGYDILSFTINGQPKYIEVKTTTGTKDKPFPITANEVAFSNQHAGDYFLYRIFEFTPNSLPVKVIIYPGSVSERFHIEPEIFNAWPKKIAPS